MNEKKEILFRFDLITVIYHILGKVMKCRLAETEGFFS